MNVQKLDRVVARSKLLYSQAEVEKSIAGLADTLNEHLSGGDWIAVTVLNGGVVFAGLIMPRLSFALRQDYIHATRYKNGTLGGDLEILAKPAADFSGQNILLLDDIFDHGVTLSEITRYFYTNGAARVCSAVMVHKKLPAQTVCEPDPDFYALTVPNVYVFGMGMDYKGYLRNAAGIYAFPEEAE